MHGGSFDAYALNAQRVFALQRISFDQSFDQKFARMRELSAWPLEWSLLPVSSLARQPEDRDEPGCHNRRDGGRRL